MSLHMIKHTVAKIASQDGVGVGDGVAPVAIFLVGRPMDGPAATIANRRPTMIEPSQVRRNRISFGLKHDENLTSERGV